MHIDTRDNNFFIYESRNFQQGESFCIVLYSEVGSSGVAGVVATLNYTETVPQSPLELKYFLESLSKLYLYQIIGYHHQSGHTHLYCRPTISIAIKKYFFFF